VILVRWTYLSFPSTNVSKYLDRFRVHLYHGRFYCWRLWNVEYLRDLEQNCSSNNFLANLSPRLAFQIVQAGNPRILLIWFWINTTYACGGVATDEKGTVIDAAPIYRKRFMGRFINDVLSNLREQGKLLGWERVNADRNDLAG
jgi:hypothetical protein